MDNIKQRRLDLENSYRNNLSEIAACERSLDEINSGEKTTHPKKYYEDRIALLTNENDVISSKLSSGDYLKDAPAAGSVSVDLSPVVTAINSGFDKVAEALKAALPKPPGA